MTCQVARWIHTETNAVLDGIAWFFRSDVIDKLVLNALARQYFIADTDLSEPNLIRKIQAAEGHAECFATGKKPCDQVNCSWRLSCMQKMQDECDLDPSTEGEY